MTKATRLTPTPTDRETREPGSGVPLRIARSIVPHVDQASSGTIAPSVTKIPDAVRRSTGCGGKPSASRATPPAVKARAVRIQARNVRSLAKVKRGSGSSPVRYTQAGSARGSSGYRAESGVAHRRVGRVTGSSRVPVAVAVGVVTRYEPPRRTRGDGTGGAGVAEAHWPLRW